MRLKIFLCLSFIILIINFCGCVEKDNQTSNENVILANFTSFDFPPVDLEKVAYIYPLGGMIGAHVTPIDHQYYVSYDFQKTDEGQVDIEVYSPCDGVVTQIQHMNVAVGDPPMDVDDFRIVIQHTSTISCKGLP